MIRCEDATRLFITSTTALMSREAMRDDLLRHRYPAAINANLYVLRVLYAFSLDNTPDCSS